MMNKMVIGIPIPQMKLTASLLLIAVSFVCQALFAQEYTAEDSTSFQRSLANSHSDADRINYQLKLADYAIKKNGSTKADQEVAKLWISKAENLNTAVKSRDAEGHILFEKGSLLQINGPSKEGFDTITRAIELLKNNPDKCLLANAYRALFIYYDSENPQEKQKKTDLIEQSLTLFNQCGNQLDRGLVLQDLAENYLATGNFPVAFKSLNESKAILDSLHYKKLQRLYDLLGTYYFIQADYENCLKNQYKALEICKQMKDSSALYCEVNNIIGMSLIDLEQYGQAIVYFKDVLMISKKNKDTSSVFSNILNLSSCFSYMDKQQEALNIMDDVPRYYNSVLNNINDKVTFKRKYLSILIKLHQNKRAGIYAQELLDLMTKPSVNKFNIINTYQTLFNYYYLIEDYDKALVCLTNKTKIIDSVGTVMQKEQNLKSWYKLDSARGDYKGAFDHLLEYKGLEDTIFNEKKSQQIQQLQVKFETQKKEDDIKMLMQNAKISEAQLRTEKLIRNVTLAVIVFVILIILLQYRRYVEKQKINLLITDKNVALQKLLTEKEWLLKEVHHRVKNNLHTVICLLESQAAYLESDALKAIENSRHRIYAMSLIHQKLYQSDDIKVVDMKTYLTEFVEYLKDSFGFPDNIRIALSAEPIKLDAAQAIPIGLIVNEAVNNAFKYAFPVPKKGEIKVELKRIEEEIFLSISDNGVGFKQQSDQEINSLGLELIKGLALDLRGTINFHTEGGTIIEIHFFADRLT